MPVPDIAKKIKSLYFALKGNCDSPQELARKINDILIWGDKIPQQLLAPAWTLFATESGVKQQ